MKTTSYLKLEKAIALRDRGGVRASGLANAADAWEELELDIPGLKPVISVRGRKIPVIKGEDGATVADVAAYLAMCVQMHENFGKTVEQIEASLKTMREHGDESSNALEAWEAAIDDDMPTDEEPKAAESASHLRDKHDLLVRMQRVHAEDMAPIDKDSAEKVLADYANQIKAAKAAADGQLMLDAEADAEAREAQD